MSIANALVILSLLTAASVHASVIYEFVGTGEPFAELPTEPVGFQLTVADFINPPLDGTTIGFNCDQLDFNTNCAGSPTATFSYQSALGAYSAALTFYASDDAEYGFFFPTGAFGVPGVYDTEAIVSNPGVLTITAIPESATVLLSFTGLLVVAGISRFRNPRA